MTAIKYLRPKHWVRYDPMRILKQLSSAKAAVHSLRTMPFQKQWVEHLQHVQLKLEVAGTSRIEGAEFDDEELELAMGKDAQEALNRSQRQARAAKETYVWISDLADDRPINSPLIQEIHRRMVTGADDDHCEPGVYRRSGHNVTFGFPRHRGESGGKDCETAMSQMVEACQKEFRDHDVLIQALALHYHFASIHPFGDGNGRTARALEALCLQRLGLRDSVFIAMSNYYYEEKDRYLDSLAEARSNDHELTNFLLFGLRGVETQCQKLLNEISRNTKKALYRDTMYKLFKRLESSRKRVIAKRALSILNIVLEDGNQNIAHLLKSTEKFYSDLTTPKKAFIRDVNQLLHIGALRLIKHEDNTYSVDVILEWPEKISESDFMSQINDLPKAKSHAFLL